MVVLKISSGVFIALTVLATTILTALVIYLLARLFNRHKKKVNPQEDLEPRLLDPESGRESRLSHRHSRQQTQQEMREDLLQRFSLVSLSPSIELLPEIKTTCCDDRASEWLEQGVAGKLVDVVDGDLGVKKPEMRQIVVAKPKKHLRWECRDGNMVNDKLSGFENMEDHGMRCTQYRLEKSSDIPA